MAKSILYLDDGGYVCRLKCCGNGKYLQAYLREYLHTDKGCNLLLWRRWRINVFVFVANIVKYSCRLAGCWYSNNNKIGS